jgi:chemotaxis protein histidine kinase CheA
MSDTNTQSDVVQDSSPVVEVVEPIEAEKVETESEQPEVEAKEAEKEHDESSLPEGVKKRIDKVTRQKYEAVAETNRLKAELEQLKAQLAPKQEAPDISNFDTLDDYVEAVAEYKYQHNMLSEQEKNVERAIEQRVAREWTAKVEKVRSVAPDFDDVFSNVANIEFAPMALEAVAQHPKGAEIAYMLGKDVSEAYRIAALPPSLQLMAIGEIAAKTSLPKPKTVSTAPKPVKPVNSGGASNTPPDDMDEWVKWRNQQLRQKR